LALLASVTFLTSGCFVIDGEHFSKPVGSNVKKRNQEDDRYWRSLQFGGFDMDVNAQAQVMRWEAPFLFWVLPIPNYREWATTTLNVRIEINPKAHGIIVDPWQTYYIATNETRIGPARVWQDRNHLGTNGSSSIAVSTKTSFFMEYAFECNPDIPFDLSIEGFSVLGERIPISIAFKPAWRLHPHFALPY
jgi:hypothetical protein